MAQTLDAGTFPKVIRPFQPGDVSKEIEAGLSLPHILVLVP